MYSELLFFGLATVFLRHSNTKSSEPRWQSKTQEV